MLFWKLNTYRSLSNLSGNIFVKFWYYNEILLKFYTSDFQPVSLQLTLALNDFWRVESNFQSKSYCMILQKPSKRNEESCQNAVQNAWKLRLV